LFDPAATGAESNVVFVAATHGWGFTVERFAQMHAACLGLAADDPRIHGKFWGDNYYDQRWRRWLHSPNERSDAERHAFRQPHGCWAVKEDPAWQRWQRRWVVLTGHALHCYIRPNSSEPEAKIQLEGCEVDASDELQLSYEREYVLELRPLEERVQPPAAAAGSWRLDSRSRGWTLAFENAEDRAALLGKWDDNSKYIRKLAREKNRKTAKAHASKHAGLAQRGFNRFVMEPLRAASEAAAARTASRLSQLLQQQDVILECSRLEEIPPEEWLPMALRMWIPLDDVLHTILHDCVPPPPRAQAKRLLGTISGSGELATAACRCDAGGPLLLCLAQLLPMAGSPNADSKSGHHFSAVARVFSGTLKPQTRLRWISWQHPSDATVGGEGRILRVRAINGAALAVAGELVRLVLSTGESPLPVDVAGSQDLLEQWRGPWHPGGALNLLRLESAHESGDVVDGSLPISRPAECSSGSFTGPHLLRLQLQPSSGDSSAMRRAIRQLQLSDPDVSCQDTASSAYVLAGRGERQLQVTYLVPHSIGIEKRGTQ
jgi:hypothetical protein